MKKIDFVIASSNNYTGFHSTNVSHPIHGYARRNVEDIVKYIRENWEGASIASDNMFDDIPDRRAYKESDIVYTNKIKTRLKQLESNEIHKLLLKNNKVLDK